MKPFIAVFIVILLASQNTSRAQHPYIPIKEDSTMSVVVIEDWDAGSSWPVHSFSYYVSATHGIDTIIHGKRYFKHTVFHQTALPIVYKQSSGFSTYRWLRNDTIARKVYMIKNLKPQFEEVLLYDFNYQKGDTIKDTTYYHMDVKTQTVWIDDLDSVYWSDGTWRYRWLIKNNYNSSSPIYTGFVRMIEGMGYTSDLFHNPFYEFYGLVTFSYDVTCYSENGQWLYHAPNPWNTTCDSLFERDYLDVQTTSKSELLQPLLYPNPVTSDGILHLNSYAGPQHEKYTIMAYDAMGRLVMNTMMKPAGSISLSAYCLKKGLYYYIVLNEKGVLITTQKVLLQ